MKSEPAQPEERGSLLISSRTCTRDLHNDLLTLFPEASGWSGASRIHPLQGMRFQAPGESLSWTGPCALFPKMNRREN
jgi:hypothetical protein